MINKTRCIKTRTVHKYTIFIIIVIERRGTENVLFFLSINDYTA